MVDEGRWADEHEGASDEEAAQHGDVFGLDAGPVTQPAPHWRRDCIHAAIYHKHHAQDHWREFKL